MGLIFNGCKNLSFVNLSNIDTSNIIFMDNMFNGC
jgi:surface protein